VRGTFHFDCDRPEHGATTYLRWVASEFRSAAADRAVIDGNRVLVRSGYFRFRPPFNPLQGVSSGWVEATPSESGIVVTYEFRLTELLLFASSALVLGLGALVVPSFPVRAIFGTVAACLALRFALEYVLAILRLRSALRAVATRVQESDRQRSTEEAG